MKFTPILLAATLFTSVAAFADDVFTCTPVADQPNGLGIVTVKITLSSEHPEASVVVTNGGGTQKYTADTEGDDVDGYNITYRAGRIFLKKGSAQVYDNQVDTFSVLSCK